MARSFVGIGSNIEPAENVRAAIRSLAQQTRLVGISMVYCTNALDRPEQPPYYNCVVEIETEAPPAEIKYGLLRAIESNLGRKRTADKYAPRTIDLDLIVYGDLVMDAEGIKLPDPEILERPFLAIPLFELAPDMVLPGYGLLIAEIADKLPQDGMKPLKDYVMLLREEASHNVTEKTLEHPQSVFTIGHSNRELAEFIRLLQAHGVTKIADVRTVPRSRHNPQFNKEALPDVLKNANIGYVHLPRLGGLRHARADLPNMAWRNASFRGFADYMQTDEFTKSMELLTDLAKDNHIALMCAEAVPWRCHRSLIADALTVRGISVEHIMSTAHRQPHALTPWARVDGRLITYPAVTLPDRIPSPCPRPTHPTGSH